VDVRLLSATHQKLSELVGQGRFREDLYYRINVIELQVPPLRERGDDILVLAQHILAGLTEAQGGGHVRLSPGAQTALARYPFPGNVRELENILERAMTLCAGDVIDIDDIRLRERPGVSQPENEGEASLGSRLEDTERDAILQALEQTRYNKTAAAKLLGISFRALRYRISKLGIE
jgi:two-component system response regulator PilR (NtrC family)